jgi:hypothetical protein
LRLLQRRMARQEKGSNRRARTRTAIARHCSRPAWVTRSGTASRPSPLRAPVSVATSAATPRPGTARAKRSSDAGDAAGTTTPT